jgi:hypothetical protein
MLNEMIAEGRYFMLEEIRKRNGLIKQRQGLNISGKTYADDTDTLLSIIDKYKEALEEIAYSGPVEDFKDIARLALKE